MKRSGPIKRRKKLRPRRKRERRSGRVMDTAYMLWVKTLQCCAPGGGAYCAGMLYPNPIEAHHAGARAAGGKASDDTCIPLCRFAHQAWHSAARPFNGWTKEQRRTWADARIAETQALYARRKAACPF